jgi:hypothetical protein
MEQKFAFKSKLKRYSALAGSFLATANMTSASIVYHDVNPDVTKTVTTMGNTDYVIDMDNDGLTDFTFRIAKFSKTSHNLTITGTGVGIIPALGSGIDYKQIGTGINVINYALALYTNDNIYNSVSWYVGGNAISSSSYGLALAASVSAMSITQNVGQFHNTTNKYLGVKFTTNSNIYYGWIRVDVGSDNNSFTLKDWAYENTPDTAIKAGQGTTTGVSTYLNSVTTIIATNNLIEASFANSVTGNVQIVNVNGAVIKVVEVNGNGCSINMSGMPSGIYFVVVSAKEGTLSKKVYLE